MNFSFTDEQELFRSGVQRFLKDKSPTTEVRRLMATDTGYDPEVWRQLSDDLGLQAIQIPELYGGAGFGPVELGIVMEELGRSLLCAPYFSSTVLAANAILNAGNESQKLELLPDIASGQQLATVAVTEPNGRWDVDGIQCTASPAGGGFRLNGTKSFVLDGCVAILLVVVARKPDSTGEDGLTFFTLAGDAEGVTRRALQGMDPTRKLARIEFHNAEALPLGDVGNGYPALAKTLDQAVVALANEMVGGTQALLDSAVAYAKMRVQFGRAIGSFQAIKHKCADMLIDVELAKSAAYYAAQAAQEDDPEVPALASLAKVSASEAYMRTAANCIQIHGGIGFTWDNDTHLWYKRAKSSEALLGLPSYHRELLMQRWGY
ncbi:MAG: acyl-CoA/acyl-ACP dehydrogenase [Gammaproteobacteria bacterium]|nr:acyl-CoA/acyl-ACP dehydrogenase [Gammaproteobacteria bacterium]